MALAPCRRGRIVALDGLRGVAALVVVVHHGLLTWPALADQYNGPHWTSRTWWLTFTPLHLVWAGTQAVIVFFLLSGIVLTLPRLRRGGGTWAGYYSRRLIRLYLPVGIAVVLAGLLVRAFPRSAADGGSWWFALHDVHATPPLLLHDALLLDGTGWLNSALWSLRHEVAFSLVLPLVVLLVRRWTSSLWFNLPMSLVLVGAGQLSSNPFAQWLPYFAVGVALAAGWDDLLRLRTRIEASPWRRVIWAALGVLAVVLLLADWWFRAGSRIAAGDNAVAFACVALGAALLCFLAVTCPALREALSVRVVQWVGRISFSLYLVHEPIVVSVSSLVGPSVRGVLLTLALGGGVAIGVAVVFHRLVEAPAQRWARRCGAWVDTRLRPAAVEAPPTLHPRPWLPPVPRPSRDRVGRPVHSVGRGHPGARPPLVDTPVSTEPR